MTDIIRVPLTKGQIAIIDAIDADLAEIAWCLHRQGYAERKDHYNPDTRKARSVLMHRVILSRMVGRQLESEEHVDHRDGDKLNNRRSNIRLASRSENARNRGSQGNGSSGYKGVNFDPNTEVNKRRKHWLARIKANGKQMNLGRYLTAEEAARAYDNAAAKFHGEFAYFNFSDEWVWDSDSQCWLKVEPEGQIKLFG